MFSRRYIELLLCLRKPEKDDKNLLKSPQRDVCKEKNSNEMAQGYEGKQVLCSLHLVLCTSHRAENFLNQAYCLRVCDYTNASRVLIFFSFDVILRYYHFCPSLHAFIMTRTCKLASSFAAVVPFSLPPSSKVAVDTNVILSYHSYQPSNQNRFYFEANMIN